MPKISIELLNQIKEKVKDLNNNYYRYISENKGEYIKNNKVSIPISDFIEHQSLNDLIDLETEKELAPSEDLFYNFLDINNTVNSPKKDQFINIISTLIFCKNKLNIKDKLNNLKTLNKIKRSNEDIQQDEIDDSYYNDQLDKIKNIFGITNTQFDSILGYVNDERNLSDIVYIDEKGKYERAKEFDTTKINKDSNELKTLENDISNVDIDNMKYNYQKMFIDSFKNQFIPETVQKYDKNIVKSYKYKQELDNDVDIVKNNPGWKKEYETITNEINQMETMINSLKPNFTFEQIKNIINNILIYKLDDPSTLDKDTYLKQKETCLNAIKDLFTKGIIDNVLVDKEDRSVGFTSISTLDNKLLDIFKGVDEKFLRQINDFKVNDKTYIESRMETFSSDSFKYLFQDVKADLFDLKMLQINDDKEEIKNIDPKDINNVNESLKNKIKFVTKPLDYNNITKYAKELKQFKKILDNKPFYICWFDGEYKKSKKIFDEAKKFIVDRGINEKALNKYIKDKTNNNNLLDNVYLKSLDNIEKYNVFNADKENAVTYKNKELDKANEFKKALDNEKAKETIFNFEINKDDLKNHLQQTDEKNTFLENFDIDKENTFLENLDIDKENAFLENYDIDKEIVTNDDFYEKVNKEFDLDFNHDIDNIEFKKEEDFIESIEEDINLKDM